MNTIYFLIYFCSFINVIFAYSDWPDYNETDIENTDAALEAFKDAILKPDFKAMLNDFEMKLIPISNNVESELNEVYLYASNRLREMEENAKGIDADFDECKNNIALPEVEALYENYKQKCVDPISTLGRYIFYIGYDKQQIVYHRKYFQMMDIYKGCLRVSDPTPGPRYCAGIILSTNDEIERISWPLKTYGLETNRQLSQEIQHLSECANLEISASTQRIQTEFDKAKECMITKINVA